LYRDGGTCWVTDHATQYFTLFIADYTVGTTIALLQTVLSLAALSVHTFRRLSWPSTIPVGARLFTVGSRLSLPLLSPTTLSALAGWLSNLTALRRRRLQSRSGSNLRWPFVGPDRCHLVLPFMYAFYGLVTGQTSVVHSQCIAVGLFLEQLRRWVATAQNSEKSVTPATRYKIYGSTALVDLGRFFSFLIYTQSVGLLTRGISPSQSHYLHTEQHEQ
jgi:hypothetical protein